VEISKAEISKDVEVPWEWRVGARLVEWRTGVNPLNFLSKWKTFIGGVGAIATGVSLMMNGDWEAGMAMVSGGFIALGWGGKLERAASAADGQKK
jgi:hypothetical protein